MILQGTNYMDFCNQLMESRVVVDPFTLTSQSRTGWDCAAMGVPMVGSDRNLSARTCFPQTSVPPFNVKAMRDKVKKLLTRGVLVFVNVSEIAQTDISAIEYYDVVLMF